MDPRLTPPEIHPALSYLWEWFWEITQGQGDSGWWITLQAWQQATGNKLTGAELDILRQLHQQYNKAVNQKLKEDK